MRITHRSSLRQVAAAVAKALQDAHIRAVLTGGACATIYTGGAYQSEDLDLILESTPKQAVLDEAMATAGFVRAGDVYRHPATRFFVEFPKGPLSIGSDIAIKPSTFTVGDVRIRLLSPTDTCRDRLAAFFHWKDRQSLKTAVAVASRHRVNLRKTREWSASEGAAKGFEEFAEAVRRARGSSRARR